MIRRVRDFIETTDYLRRDLKALIPTLTGDARAEAEAYLNQVRNIRRGVVRISGESVFVAPYACCGEGVLAKIIGAVSFSTNGACLERIEEFLGEYSNREVAA